jgi:hypothetical protein
MAKKKGPRMVNELVRRRANGEGFQKISRDLGIARNTVKSRLKELGAYEIKSAQKILLSGGGSKKTQSYMAPWAGEVCWKDVLREVEGGTPIKEFWEIHISGSHKTILSNIPYETFWREFRRRHPNIDIHYHKNHEPGIRTEIDYKGDTPGLGYIDRSTGEFIDCRLFGQVLCSSRLFFGFATPDEKRASWLDGISSGFQYFGGATEILVVDNARVAVNRADWFDPDVNQEFYNFCSHFNTTVIPARPRRPKDKNLIEVHLGVFWRWVRRRLRKQSFFSQGELNRFLRSCSDEFNRRYQRKYGSSRRQRFEKNEQSSLRPLPHGVYELGEWKKCKLHEDCHIQHKYNFYSAPYQYRRKELDVRVTSKHIEIFFNQERIGLHQKRPDHQRGNYSTDKSHLPEKFQAMEEFSVSRQIAQAKKIGTCSEQIITNLLTEVSHPLMFLRRTMGILRLKGRYGSDKLERSCEILLNHGFEKPSVKQVETMIKSPNLTNQPVLLPIDRKPNSHLRGQMSFKLEQGEMKNEPSIESNRSVSAGTLTQGDEGDSGESN